MAILKVPRTGSTWLAKELRAFGTSVQLKFEPFTDAAAHTCSGRFYTQALGKALGSRQRCVTRESRSLPCYWGWLGCNATRLKPRPYPANASPEMWGPAAGPPLWLVACVAVRLVIFEIEFGYSLFTV